MASGGQSFAAILDRLERGRGMKQVIMDNNETWRDVNMRQNSMIERARAALASAGVKL